VTSPIDLLLAVLLVSQPGPGSAPEPVRCLPGVPVSVEYPVPEGWEPCPLECDSTWSIVSQEGGRVTLVPLVLDTLRLPPMQVTADTLSAFVQAPLLLVERSMPDSSWTLAPFPAPVPTGLPGGFPSDYLRRHAFWEDWRAAEPFRWIVPALLGAAVLGALLAWMLARRRRATAARGGGSHGAAAGLTPEQEALALMDGRAFSDGDWPVYYADVERLLRSTAAARFSVSNPALTWRQVERTIRTMDGGREFADAADPLAREIALQRYAAYGGSRERARKHTMHLAGIRRDWHR